MLERLGLDGIDDLLRDLPGDKVLSGPLDLPPGLSELEVVELMKGMSAENVNPDEVLTFLGAGVYDHFVPAVVPWVTSRPEFATAYTPYQAEVSQGTLESIYEYQTLMCKLTAMDVANASIYDGASAVAEAALMAARISRRGRVVVSETVHPHHAAVVESYARGGRIDVVRLPATGGATDPDAISNLGDAACVIVQSPNFYGAIEPVEAIAECAHRAGMLVVVSCDPISLAVLTPPGELGADIAVGEGQALGTPMAFGGPLLGFFATKRAFLRQMPGRVVGRTRDAAGDPCYVMTLQTREQHIRREKATSNICTNQALMALAASVYLSALGRDGFRRVGELSLRKSHYALDRIAEVAGFSLRFERPFFKEFAVRCPVSVDGLLERLRERRILGGVPLGRYSAAMDDCLLVAVTERRTRADIDRYVDALKASVRELETAGGTSAR